MKKGTISGDVLFFRLDSGKYLGSFGFLTEAAGDSPPDRLNKELLEAFPGTLFSRFKSVVPDVSTTFDLDK